MTGAAQPTRRAILFANPGSGRGRRWLWRIIDQCRSQGIELVNVHFDLSDGYVERALATAEQAGIRAVLVAGGDGTAGTIAAHVVKTSLVLGVLPAGTSNDFARSLTIPMDVAGAVRVVAEGRVTKVDVGCAGDRMFVHAAIVGINTDFARRAQALRRWIGRLSYPIAAVQVYLHRTRFPLTLTNDGREECFDAFEAALINAPVYGGPLRLEIPEAELTDRRLSVVVVTDITWQVLVRALPRALTHRSLRLPGVEMFSIRTARIDTGKPMPITVDGELAGSTPTTMKVIPSSLSVYVPHSFTERRR